MKNKEKLNIKRDLILDVTEALFIEEGDNHISISKIAKKAGVGKGSIYYYFSSRDEIIDALIERIYSMKVKDWNIIVNDSSLSPYKKFEDILSSYLNNLTAERMPLLKYTYKKENEMLRIKTKEENMKNLVPIIARIHQESHDNGIYICDYPEEFAIHGIAYIDFALSFLLLKDSVNLEKRLLAIEVVFENAIEAPKGSFSFLHQLMLKHIKNN